MQKRFLFIFIISLLVACGPQEQDLRRPGTPLQQAAEIESTAWQYDEFAPYFGVLPIAVQQLQSPHAAEVGHAVCAALGGRLDILQHTSARQRVGFNCAFVEHGVGITTEFGDLRRIRTNSSAR